MVFPSMVREIFIGFLTAELAENAEDHLYI
jgi:hypothetical protein